MAGIIGFILNMVEYGNVNPNLSTELNDLVNPVPFLDWYDPRTHVIVGTGYPRRIAAANTWNTKGTILESFFGDYYNRIHVDPARIELGTVASTVSRNVSVWNAYVNADAVLDDVLIQNGVGITAQGDVLPYTFSPLQERFWEVRITPNGPPEINARILFDFENVADPLPVVIVGNRAVVLPATPNVPVRESWRWLTDVHVSQDGTEQRVGLRDNPRRSLATQLVFESEAELRQQYQTMLTSNGRLFVPYFQYSTTVKQDALAGDTVLVFDTAYVDLRPGDYVLLLSETMSALVQLDTIGAASAGTQAPLSFNVAKGTKVVSVFPSILPNNLTLNRIATNNYGTMSMSSTATYPRPVVRPGGVVGFNVLDGHFVVERRPLVDGNVDYSFDTGQEILDSQVGLFDVATDWDFTKVESSFSFLVRRLGRYACQHRSGVDEMDYWRVFADRMKGSLGSFLLSTYRPDQLLASPTGLGSDNLVLVGPSYVDSFWPALAYHYVAIYTEAGVHYAKVNGASKNSDGNVAITFAPALPNAVGWDVINQISYVLKMRIADDEIEWSHYQLDSIVRFRTRTVKE